MRVLKSKSFLQISCFEHEAAGIGFTIDFMIATDDAYALYLRALLQSR